MPASGKLYLGLAMLGAGEPEPLPALRRYLVQRTFPAGVLEHIDRAATERMIANNRMVGVRWTLSYVSADHVHTYCIYEAPDVRTLREAARLSGLPVDTITEIPDILAPFAAG